MKSSSLHRILPVVLAILGSSRMLAEFFDAKPLHALGLASGIAPYPKVFTATDGYEAFTSRFFLSADLPDGSAWQTELHASNPSRLQGPYQRRNVYGAALCFSPCLPEPLRGTLLERALSPGSPIRRELGIPADSHRLRLLILPEPGAPFSEWSWTAPGL